MLSVIPRTLKPFQRALENDFISEAIDATLLRELIYQLHLVAVAGSLVHAAQARQSVDTVRQLPHFLPDMSKICCANLSSRNNIYSSLYANLQEFSAKVDFAGRVTADWSVRTLARADLKVDGDVEIDAAEVAEIWKGIAGAGKLQLFLVLSLVSQTKFSTPRPDAANVGNLLDAVSEGQAPCVRDDGSIEYGVLVDRRHAPRIALSGDAQIGVAGQVYNCEIRDVSISGAGISCSKKLSVYAPVVLYFNKENHISATVIWCEDGRAGLEFSEPLLADDPLFSIWRI